MCSIQAFVSSVIHLTPYNVLHSCKVVIPRGTERSYGIRWRSETRVTNEAKGDGWTDGQTDRQMEHIAQV